MGSALPFGNNMLGSCQAIADKGRRACLKAPGLFHEFADPCQAKTNQFYGRQCCLVTLVRVMCHVISLSQCPAPGPRPKLFVKSAVFFSVTSGEPQASNQPMRAPLVNPGHSPYRESDTIFSPYQPSRFPLAPHYKQGVNFNEDKPYSLGLI